jgi:hypothetical protein
MVTHFMEFILSTNLLTSSLLCFAFVILSVGILSPIISFVFAVGWAFVDDKGSIGDNWFITKVLGFLPNPNPYEIRGKVGDYHVFNKDTGKYHYRIFNSNRTQGMMDHDTRCYDQEVAERKIEKLMKYNFDYYFVGVGLLSFLAVLIALLLHFQFWPVLYILSLVGSIWGVRSLRRFQKKGIEMMKQFKEHTEKSAEEAHKE